MPKEPPPISGKGRGAGERGKLIQWRANLLPSTLMRWQDIDASLIRGAIEAVTQAGGAIILGVTRDGGALSICVLMDDQKSRDYPASIASAEEALRALIEYFA